jgi:hypothetical protein
VTSDLATEASGLIKFCRNCILQLATNS